MEPLKDHRDIGRELDLFVFRDEVGSGLPLLTEKGTTIRRELERFIVDEEIKRGYQHVSTPELAKVKLYEISGHYPYYKDTMYPVMQVDEDKLILRPMTCPHHFMLYSSRPRSYRELPIRMAELAKLFRYEKSGQLTGLVRLRSFCLSDAHIFCTKEQASSEIREAIELINYSVGVLGLKKGQDYSYRLSLGDPNNKNKYYDDPAGWQEGESVLRETLKSMNETFVEASDEAAFYGPKIDVQMKNALGKEETAFTVQYDFCLPKRFELSYINSEGRQEQPVVIHRSSIGAIERTMAFLLEHYAGALPLWLSPVQVAVLNISDKQHPWATAVTHALKHAGIRTELYDQNETLGKKIRLAETQKIPYIAIVGNKEMISESITIRARGNKDIGEIPLQHFIEKVLEEIKKRSV